MTFPSLVVLSCVLHLVLGIRLVPALGQPLAGTLLAVLLVVSAVLMPAGLVARRWLRPPASDWLTWVGMVCMGLFSSLAVLALLRELVLLGAWLATLGGAVIDAGQLHAWSARAVVALALAGSVLGFANARRTAAVRRVQVRIPGLPAALQGLRIVQITDIHVGPTIKVAYLQAIVDRVNALQPDVIAVTGDIVDGSVPELQAHVAPLGTLRARHGSYFVTGNHEYYAGVHAWTREMQRLGLHVLHNSHVVLQHGDGQLVLAGVPDYGAHHFDEAHRSDPAAALAGAPGNAPRVLLAHQPRTAPAASAAGFDLQLSGHTHGGQFFPWSFFVPLQQPYTAGLHRLGGLQVYVSRGTGYWGPPKRLFAPSEIAEITLVG
ncbi:MAG: metallophosphoesterase [Comamonadaceae bacterium]|nr:MAG: metallophosphoesterase [Comamonadaceae bacterium]